RPSERHPIGSRPSSPKHPPTPRDRPGISFGVSVPTERRSRRGWRSSCREHYSRSPAVRSVRQLRGNRSNPAMEIHLVRMSRRMPWTLCFAGAALAAAMAAGAALAEPVAFVVALKGSATVTSKAKSTRAALGFGLERGDKVQVGKGSALTIYFSDGNVVELGAGSSLTVSGQLASNGQKVGPGSNASSEVFARVSKF